MLNSPSLLVPYLDFPTPAMAKMSSVRILLKGSFLQLLFAHGIADVCGYGLGSFRRLGRTNGKLI